VRIDSGMGIEIPGGKGIDCNGYNPTLHVPAIDVGESKLDIHQVQDNTEE